MSDNQILLDSDVDLERVGALLGQARREARMTQAFLGNKVGVSERTLSRWETGAIGPSLSQLRELIAMLSKANAETLDALKKAAHLVPKLAPVPSIPPGPSLLPSAAPGSLDDSIRAFAEDLDVSARRLRMAMALLLGDIEKAGLSVNAAKELLMHPPKRRV
jgi:DNA-binding XRE family transcriptional regulator